MALRETAGQGNGRRWRALIYTAQAKSEMMKETSEMSFDGDGFLSHVLSRTFVCAAFMIPPLFFVHFRDPVLRDQGDALAEKGDCIDGMRVAGRHVVEGKSHCVASCLRIPNRSVWHFLHCVAMSNGGSYYEES